MKYCTVKQSLVFRKLIHRFPNRQSSKLIGL